MHKDYDDYENKMEERGDLERLLYSDETARVMDMIAEYDLLNTLSQDERLRIIA